MQIYEIAQQKTQEGILKGIANVSKGLATAAATNILRQMPVDVSQTVDTPAATSASGARTLASNLSKNLVVPIAQQQAQRWDKTLKTLTQQYGTPGGPRWPTGVVEDDLDAIINKTLMSDQGEWSKIESMFRNDPKNNLNAKQVQDRIENARNTILKTLPSGPTASTAQTLLPTWQNLVGAAFDAQNLIIHARTQPGNVGITPSSTSASTGGSSGAVNPIVQRMAQAASNSGLTASRLGIKNSTIATLQSRFPPGTDPKIDQLFTALGLY